MKDDVDEVPGTDFSKSAARVFDKIDHVKDGILPLSKFVDLIEELGVGWGVHTKELAGHLRKLYPNESGSLDRLSFVRCFFSFFKAKKT